MPLERASDVKFEIGHVLFIDIVGYSKLLISEQSDQLQRLKQIVRSTEQVRIAEAEGKLLRLPTGDGGALVFRNSSEASAKRNQSERIPITGEDPIAESQEAPNPVLDWQKFDDHCHRGQSFVPGR